MKFYSRKFINGIVLFAFFFLISETIVVAHSGGTDKNGCHHDRKNGGYHCH
jgi:hypothetical protein